MWQRISELVFFVCMCIDFFILAANFGGSMIEDEKTIIFLRRVANAVIIRSLKDLRYTKGTYRYNTARNFCFGLTEDWKESRDLWAELADVSPEKIIKKAEELINAI